MTTNDNPCLNCPDNCCSIRGWCGLILSKDEFETHFKAHEQHLNVREENKAVIISAKEGAMCPHFAKGGCRIYLVRPIDCRLYPCQMRFSYETRKKVKFILHNRSDCPRKQNLLMPETEAKLLIRDFAEKVFGDKEILIDMCDTLIARLKNKGESLLVRCCNKIGLL